MGGTNIEGLGYFSKLSYGSTFQLLLQILNARYGLKEISYIISNQTDEQKIFLNIL